MGLKSYYFHFDRYSFEILSTVLPHIIPFDFGESPFFAGQAIQVTCFVMQGDPPLNISWSFNNMDISSRSDITTIRAGSKGSMLVIDSASSQHSGQYTCNVRNPVGVTNYSATLKINGIHKVWFFCSLFLKIIK